jgi:hypothetical protein
MRTRRSASITDLRLAIDCLPRNTREAMLKGIAGNEIIVGAYTDGDGICPMLAAHRAGGRTNFIGFARAWDRFAFRSARVRLSRRATERELLVLRTHLEASLLDEDCPAPDLAAAMAEHRELVARPRRTQSEQRSDARPGVRADPRRDRTDAGTDRRPGDPDRSRELRTRPGWAWMRVFRRYEDYERALAWLESEEQSLADAPEAEVVPAAPRRERELVR